MARIRYGDHVDPGGKPVDVVPAPQRLWIWSYEADARLTRDAVLPLTVELLGSLATASAKALRQRELVVWWGEIANAYGPVYVLGFPERLHNGVHRILAPLTSMKAKLSWGAYDLADTGCTPLASYDHGRIVAYTDPFSPPGHVAGAELRSAELVASRSKDTGRKPLPRLPEPHGAVYGVTEWRRAARAVVGTIGELFAPGTYRSLKTMITSDLQIPVTERDDSGFRALGRITAGWLDSAADGEPGCPVAITIRANIAAELRYVALAHELAHFVLHFPLLLAAQIVEQLSWEFPELERAWENKLRISLPTYERLEHQADSLAVHLLIPPRYFPLARLTEKTRVGSYGQPQPQHLVWHLLQPLFPDTAGQNFSWANWEEHERRAAEQTSGRGELELAGDSLYARMLKAALLNEHRASAALPQPDSPTLELVDIVEWLFDIIDEFRTTHLSAREFFGGPHESGDAPRLPGDIVALARTREVIEPLLPPAGVPRRLPLVPEHSTDGNRTRLWRSPLIDAPPADLETWQARAPDRAVMLYPDSPRLP